MKSFTAPSHNTLNQVISLFDEIITSGPRTVSKEWFSLKLRMPHLRILFLLLSDGSKMMSELACGLGVSVSGTTSLVDKLVEQNLVMRHVDPSNRRSIICNITSEGKNLATNLINQRKSKWELMLSNLSENDLRLVKKTLRLIIDSNAEYKQESSNRKLQSIFN